MTIERAHLYRPVFDDDVLLTNITVRFYEPGTTTAIAGPIFTGPAGSSEINQPVVFPSGVIDAYFSDPQRIRLGITPEGQSEFFLEDVDVLGAAPNAVLADQILLIRGTPTPGDAITAHTDGTARWVAPGGGGDGGSGFREGTGSQFSVLGGDLTNPATASADYTLAVGDDAVASAENAHAFGNNAQATGTGALAVGHNSEASGAEAVAIGIDSAATADFTTTVGVHSRADGENSTSIGYFAQAAGPNTAALGDGATAPQADSTAVGSGATTNNTGTSALGSRATADGVSSTAIGDSAQAHGDDAIGIGRAVLADGLRAVAIGATSTATGDRSTAVGNNTVAQGDRSMALGTDAQSASNDTAVMSTDALELKASSAFNAATVLRLYDGTSDSNRKHSVGVSSSKRLTLDGVSVVPDPQSIAWGFSTTVAAGASESIVFVDGGIVGGRSRPSWASYAFGDLRLAKGVYSVLVSVLANTSSPGVSAQVTPAGTGGIWTPQLDLYMPVASDFGGFHAVNMSFHASQDTVGQLVGFNVSPRNAGTASMTIETSVEVLKIG